MAVAHPPSPGAALSSPGPPDPAARSGLTHWPLHAVVWAAAGIVGGLIWDISWHRSVGRDTLFSPPHVLEYISAVVAGVTCGYVVLRTTFGGSAAARAASVRFWGFRGPLGAWVTIWGTFTMLVSAPFDDWWHNAYGLDVEILSPPHVLLLFGMLGIVVGALLMTLAAQNRAPSADAGVFPSDAWLYTVAGGVTLLMVCTATMQYTGFANLWHGSQFYRITGATLPLLLVVMARAGRLRWPATRAALVYVGVTIVAAWILQSVPATPKLPPILNPIDRMVPPPFPMLLFVPALAIDLLLWRWEGAAGMGRRGTRNIVAGRRFPWGRDLRMAPVLGAAFVLLMFVVHWPLAEFLLSPAAENAVFFQGQWDYNVNPAGALRAYWTLDTVDGVWSPAAFARGVGGAVLLATVSSLAGLRVGAWMRGVQR